MPIDNQSKKELLDSVTNQWDDPADFFVSSEWQLFKELCLDEIVALHFEAMSLKPEGPDFPVRFAYLQGSMDTLYRRLRLFESRNGKMKPDQLAAQDFTRRQGLTARIKSIVKHTIGAKDA